MKIKKEKKALTQGKAMHPFIPLLVMVVLCTIISYFVVPGAYDRETVDGVTRVVADSYHAVERTPVSLFNMFRSIPEGLTATANMMFCIMLIAGMHIFPKLPAGTISVDPGPRYTSAGFMKIKIIGKSGHGAMPESAVDPIYVGAKVVDALQSITSREVKPNDTVVVSICTFHCGTLPNIIAESAELTGTVRTFNPKLQKQLPESSSGSSRGHVKPTGQPTSSIITSIFRPPLPMIAAARFLSGQWKTASAKSI